MVFEKHKTSCFYEVSGRSHAFTEIDFARKLIYLNEGGINSIPVRLSDVKKVQVMGLGELKITGEQHEWVKW